MSSKAVVVEVHVDISRTRASMRRSVSALKLACEEYAYATLRATHTHGAAMTNARDLVYTRRDLATMEAL